MSDRSDSKFSEKSSDLRNKAEKKLNHSPSEIKDLSDQEVRRLVEELRVHQYELEIQNEELRNTEEELELSREQFFDLYELAPVGYFTVGMDDQVLRLNLNAAGLLEGDKGEFEGIGFSRLIHPEDHKVFYSHRKKVLDTGANQNCEVRMMKKDGSIFYARLNIGILRNEKDNYLLITTSDITELKEKERELMQMYTAVENTTGSIIITDTEGFISYANNATHNLFSNPVGKNFTDLFDPKEHKKVKVTLSKLKEKESMTEEFYISREDYMALESNMSVMKDNDEIIGFLISSRDVSERKKSEQDLKRKLMEFKLEEGNLYLEGNFDKSVTAFEELTNAGFNGVIVSRTPSEELKNKLNLSGFEFLWVAERGDVSSLSELINKIDGFPQKKVVFIDRLDYFIARDGFKKTLEFVYSLKDMAYLKNLTVILVLDSSILDDKSFALLKKEANEIELRDMEKISDDLLSILKYIYSQNKMGHKPSYTDLCEHLNVSKPTIRKKITSLVNKDYLRQDHDGRHKLLEITEKARNLFST